MSNAERFGPPIRIPLPEIIEIIDVMVLVDPRLRVCDIVETIGISYGSVVSILNNYVGIRKLSTIWVSRLTTICHKGNLVSTLNEWTKLNSPQHNGDQAPVETAQYNKFMATVFW